MEGTLGIAVILVLVGVMFAQARLSSRLRRQEELLAKLSASLGLTPDSSAEPSESVKELAKSSNSYIAAIKAYREQTGAGLKEAKAVIDDLKRDGAVR